MHLLGVHDVDDDGDGKKERRGEALKASGEKMQSFAREDYTVGFLRLRVLTPRLYRLLFVWR